MSGIVALFERGAEEVDRGVFRSMVEDVDHRGPDGRGVWFGSSVGLGHQQLQSTRESAFDDQPSHDDGLVITADARIDNRGDLLDELAVDGPADRIPDSRLIRESYREWGRACVDHLVGAFAFVIWDADEGSAFCARDHFGVKPLYYHRSDDAFAVASEITPLLRLPSVTTTLDETRVGDFLVGRFGDKSNTFYEDVRRLPPAHVMSVTDDDATTRQYWDLDPSRTVELESDEAYERRFRELFVQAVECRLRSTDAVGATLSGGTDSSSITAVARDLLPEAEPLHTFSWVFDDAPTSDEREYIETLTDRPGIVPHYLRLDDIGVLVDGDDVFSGLAEPPFNTMHHAWWATAKRAAEHDVGVVLDGALGDSAISYGLGLLPHLLRTGRWRRLKTELEQLGERWGTSPRRLLVNRAVKPLLPEPLVRMTRSLRGEAVLEQQMNPTLDPEFVDRIGLRARYRSLYEDRSLFGQSPRRQQYDSLMVGLTTANLEAIDEKYARFGVEPRHPFTDKRLVEFSLAMPAGQQLSDGYTRSIIRRALGDLLPERIRDRGWKTPVSEGFWNSLSIESETLETLLSDPEPISEYVDIDELRTAYREFEGEEWPDPDDARALWRALSLWLWLRRRETNHGEETAVLSPAGSE